MAVQIGNSVSDPGAKTEAQTMHSAPDSAQPSDSVTRMERALRAMQEQLDAARQQITWLGESNVRLRHQLISLAHREAQVNHDAYHDPLTCLPNRRLLLDRLNQALGQAVRQHKQVVLLLIDLDGFKTVNDRLGHAAGDKLLQAVAERLVACIRGADTACRYGGMNSLSCCRRSTVRNIVPA